MKFADDVGDAAANKAPYHPRSMDGLLKKKYGADTVSSSTLPKTSMPNVKLAGKSLTMENGTRITFDQRGYPIFEQHTPFEIKISSSAAQSSSKTHMRAATQDLNDSIARGQTNPSVFTSEQLTAIRSGQTKIPGFTWHHHQDTGRMQLIPTEIHRAVRHVGGMEMWGKR